VRVLGCGIGIAVGVVVVVAVGRVGLGSEGGEGRLKSSRTLRIS